MRRLLVLLALPVVLTSCTKSASVTSLSDDEPGVATAAPTVAAPTPGPTVPVAVSPAPEVPPVALASAAVPDVPDVPSPTALPTAPVAEVVTATMRVVNATPLLLRVHVAGVWTTMQPMQTRDLTVFPDPAHDTAETMAGGHSGWTVLLPDEPTCGASSGYVVQPGHHYEMRITAHPDCVPRGVPVLSPRVSFVEL